MLGSIDLQQCGDEPSGFIIVDDASARLFVAGFQNVSHDSCNSSSSGEDADQLPFVVGNRQLPKRPRAPSYNDHDVAAANVDDFTAHQPAPGEDQDIVGESGRFIFEGVLIEAEGRRDSNHLPAPVLSPARRSQWQTRTGTGNNRTSCVGNTGPE